MKENQGRVGGERGWHPEQQLMPDAIPSGASWHVPFVSSDLQQLKNWSENWRTSKEIHWQLWGLLSLSSPKPSDFPHPTQIALNTDSLGMAAYCGGETHEIGL